MLRYGYVTALLILFLSACSIQFYAKGAVYTERGLEAGNGAWQEHFDKEAERCTKLGENGSDEVRECFGPTDKQDKIIGTTISSSVALLRTFWAAYAAGADKSRLREILMVELPEILKDLPIEYFGGLKK